MKRTKPPSQPTRIMPRRGNRGRDTVSNTDAVDGVQSNPTFERRRCRKTIKRVATESGIGSDSLSEFEETASTSTRNDRHRRKRESVDVESSTRSQTSPLNEVSASINRRGVCESPELGCSICLGAVENRAFTDACYHSFCFECLVEWSRVRAVCPLCKKSFNSIIHSFRSYDDYKLYQVPTTYVSNIVNISSLSSSESSNLFRVGRLQNNNNLPARSFSSDEQMLAFRRRVYTHAEDMQLCGLWSSDGVVMPPRNQVSPAMFDCYPVMQERVRPWVLRDVAVIIGNGDVQYVAGIVLDLLRHFPLTSEDFYERLFPYLGLHTRRFLRELESFARSPFDMTTYDARVVYSTGTSPDTSLHLPADRVEDVSSSDDSDIEIVTPALVTSSEPTVNSHISDMTDHILPDFVHCLQTIQRNLMMSFNSMNRPTLFSGFESPVPGPSGLGQAVLSEESGSVGSQASRSAHDADERSDSPMVLSDADSDIVVVNIDRPARSPIHISSGEDEDHRDECVRTRRPVKRRRHRSRHHKKRRRRFEQGDSLTNNADCATDNEVPLSDEALPEVEPHATDYHSVDRCVESTAEELIHIEEPGESSDRTQNLSSCHSADVNSNDHSSASAKLSSSKLHLWLDDDKISDAGRRALQPTYPARSRSANSVDNASVTSLHSTDDVKPLTCKKHVSGHKSSKQKARELAADKRSAEVVGDNSEKSVPSDEVGVTDGSCDLPDSGSSEQNSADLLNPLILPSFGESSIASGDVTSSASKDCKMVPDGQLDDEVPLRNDNDEVSLPCASETRLIQVVSAAGGRLENIGLSSFSTSEGTAADLCLPMANENSCDAKASSTSSDASQTHSPDEIELLSNNAADVEQDCSRKNSSKCENPTTSSDCIQHHDDGNDEVCCSDAELVSSSYVTTKLSSPPTDSCALLECGSFSPEPSSDVKVSAASHSSLNSPTHFPVVKSYKLDDQNTTDLSDEQPTESGVSDRLSVSPQHNEAALFASSNSHQNSQFDYHTNCLRITSPQDKSLCDDRCGLVSPDRPSTHRSLPGWLRSSCSTSGGGLVIDQYPASPTTPDLVINDSIVICSPVGVLSSDSDSEVEWLETGTAGHHRCISISSGGSSVVFSPSHDDLESVLSDTDSLEIFDDEPPASPMPEDYSAEPGSLSQTPVERSPPLLPSVSDVSSSMDVHEVENVLSPEQVKSDNETESSDSDHSH